MSGPFHVDEFFHALSEEERELKVLVQIDHDAVALQRELRGSDFPQETIYAVLRAWRLAFNESLDVLPTRSGILLASTANVDAICRLTQEGLRRSFLEASFIHKRLPYLTGVDLQRTELENALDAAEALTGAQLEAECSSDDQRELCNKISRLLEDPASPTSAVGPAEIIGYILRGLVKGEDPTLNKKPFVPQQCLVRWIERVFGPSQRVVGGASATINNHMARRGVPGAALLTSQFSQQLAELHHTEAHIVTTNDTTGDLEISEARNSGRADDLTKLHTPVEWVAGNQFQLCGIQFRAAQTDRIIFRTANWWDHTKGEWVRTAWEPGLAHCGFGSGESLARIAARFRGIILSGLQYVKPGDASSVGGELETLRAHGVRLHVEFSGDPKNARVLRELLRGRVSSLGIGEELAAVLDALGIPPMPGGDAYADYLNAQLLAKEFHLERLYVHRSTADIILRRKTGPQIECESALKAEIAGNLHTKYVTICWICGESLGRTVRTVSDLLRREGILDLLNFSLRLAQRLGLEGIEKERFVRHVGRSGYCVPPDTSEDFGVAVVPVKWTYGISHPITTSVGDLSSGFSFAFGGYV